MSDINIRERRKYFKREARVLLKYNYIKQVFMSAVIVLISFGIKAVKLNVGIFFELEYNLAYLPLEIVFDFILLLVTIPLFIGIIYVNTKLFEGINLPVSGMFQYFASPSNLVDCYRFILSMTLRLCVSALPFFIFGTMIASGRKLVEEILPSSITADIVMIAISAFYIIAFIVCAIIMTRYFATIFIFVKNPCLNVYDIIKKSSQLMKRKKAESIKLILSFTFWIILSHYLAGVLFVFFTIPYIMLSYTSYMSYLLIEKEKDGDFLSPANDYIDDVRDNLHVAVPKAKSKVSHDNDLSEIFELDEDTKTPFDIIDIDENYLTDEQYEFDDLEIDMDIMQQKTKVN